MVDTLFLYVLFIGDLNLFFFLFFFLFMSLVVNPSNSLHLLLTAELLWITLYVMVLSAGFIYDNVNLLSLTFFFLVLSAVEFGMGLIIILIQNIFFSSMQLSNSSKNFMKNSLSFSNKMKSFQLPWL